MFWCFKMVAILQESYNPISNHVISPNRFILCSFEQGSNKEVSTCMVLVCTISGKPRAGDVNLPPNLLKMFSIKGLCGAYTVTKNEFTLISSLFSTLNTKGIAVRCAIYTSPLTAMGNSTEDTYT